MLEGECISAASHLDLVFYFSEGTEHPFNKAIEAEAPSLRPRGSRRPATDAQVRFPSSDWLVFSKITVDHWRLRRCHSRC